MRRLQYLAYRHGQKQNEPKIKTAVKQNAAATSWQQVSNGSHPDPKKVTHGDTA